MSIKLEHRVYTKGDKTALLSISENAILTIINDESKMCESIKEAHTKLLTLGYKKIDTIEEELDEATSPTAGTRLVKKYGEDAHRAEVRYSPDWQEYSVHHYKDGKHMGEGPVSYHGDDKEDAHDTAKSEAAKRSTVKEDTDQLDELSKATMKSYLEKGIVKGMKDAREGKGDISKKREAGLNKAMAKVYTKEDLNEESSDSLKKMSNYHYHEADYHAKKAGELENNNPKKVRHIEASNRHGAAAIHYDKASTAAKRDHKEKQDYHIAHAEEYADAAEEHERTHNLMEALEEAHKLGDTVMIHKGSMAGTKGTIGEIRPGMFKGAPKTYTVDYSEPGKESRQSVQVKKEHIKAIKEDTDQLDELKKSTLASYTQKAASSMANAAFGQGQASAQYKEPQEKDVKLFSKRLKGIGTATTKLAEARGDADELWDKAEEHKKLANANKDNKEKFHSHMYKHHELIARYHSDLGQHSSAERHDKKADDHYNKAAGFGVDEAVIDPKDTRNPDIPTYLRKQQGQKPLSYAEVKARSTKNVDAYRKRAGVLEDTTVEIFPELAAIVENNATSSVKFKNGETAEVKAEHADALINLHGMLSDENKQKLAEYAHHSAGNFSKVVDWALTKIK
jgi:hypothetical protein